MRSIPRQLNISPSILLVGLLATFVTDSAVAQRWGIPGQRNASGNPDWTLTKPSRSTYSNSRSAAPRYDASLNGRYRTYSAAPTRSQYSAPPPVGNYRGRGNAFSYYGRPQHGIPQPYLNPYVNIFYNGIGDYSYLGPSSQQFLAPGGAYGNGYPTMSAPPVVVPYGTRSTAIYQRVPVGSSFSAPLSIGATVVLPGSTPAAATTLSPILIPAPAGGTPTEPAPLTQPSVSTPVPVDEGPIVNEIEGAAIPPFETISATDRIRSLRYQTSGDDAFRRRDFASAAALYEAAAETAPDRRAAVLRQVWALTASQDFPGAVAQLKKALKYGGEPGGDWISADELYGANVQADAALHGNELWDWLQERPNSTDRLLLASAFQRFRGLNGASRELLATARRLGLPESTATSLEQLSEPVMLVQPENASSRSGTDGIHMKGSELVPVPQLPLTQ